MKTTLAPVGLATLLLLSAACGEDSTTDPGPPGTPAAHAVADLADALQQQDLAAYVALLESPVVNRGGGFRFHVRESDRVYSWLEGGEWNYDDEIGIVTNWFDPEFEIPGGRLLGLDVVDLAITAEQENEDGTIDVSVDASVVARLPAGAELALTAPLEIGLAPDGDGGYLIRSIRELERLELDAGAASPLTESFGVLKSRYRERRGFAGQTGPPELDSASNAILAHRHALVTRDYDSYLGILAQPFEFCPRADEVADFPWMSGPCWDGTTEEGIVRNLFDPRYTGAEPAVESIGFDYDILFESNIFDEQQNIIGVRSVLQVSFEVLVPSGGWTSNTRLEVDALVSTETPDRFEIARIEEQSALRSDELSWASVKALYRDPVGLP